MTDDVVNRKYYYLGKLANHMSEFLQFIKKKYFKNYCNSLYLVVVKTVYKFPLCSAYIVNETLQQEIWINRGEQKVAKNVIKRP